MLIKGLKKLSLGGEKLYTEGSEGSEVTASPSDHMPGTIFLFWISCEEPMHSKGHESQRVFWSKAPNLMWTKPGYNEIITHILVNTIYV